MVLEHLSSWEIPDLTSISEGEVCEYQQEALRHYISNELSAAHSCASDSWPGWSSSIPSETDSRSSSGISAGLVVTPESPSSSIARCVAPQQRKARRANSQPIAQGPKSATPSQPADMLTSPYFTGHDLGDDPHSATPAPAPSSSQCPSHGPAPSPTTTRASHRRQRHFTHNASGAATAEGTEAEALVDLAGEGDLLRATAAVAAALLPSPTVPVRMVPCRSPAPVARDAAALPSADLLSREGRNDSGRPRRSGNGCDGSPGEGAAGQSEGGGGGGGGPASPTADDDLGDGLTAMAAAAATAAAAAAVAKASSISVVRSKGSCAGAGAGKQQDHAANRNGLAAEAGGDGAVMGGSLVPLSPGAGSGAAVSASAAHEGHPGPQRPVGDGSAGPLDGRAAAGEGAGVGGGGKGAGSASRRRMLRAAGALQVTVHAREDLGIVLRPGGVPHTIPEGAGFEPTQVAGRNNIGLGYGNLSSQPATPTGMPSPSGAPPASPGTPATGGSIPSPGGRRGGGGRAARSPRTVIPAEGGAAGGVGGVGGGGGSRGPGGGFGGAGAGVGDDYRGGRSERSAYSATGMVALAAGPHIGNAYACPGARGHGQVQCMYGVPAPPPPPPPPPPPRRPACEPTEAAVRTGEVLWWTPRSPDGVPRSSFTADVNSHLRVILPPTAATLTAAAPSGHAVQSSLQQLMMAAAAVRPSQGRPARLSGTGGDGRAATAAATLSYNPGYVVRAVGVGQEVDGGGARIYSNPVEGSHSVLATSWMRPPGETSALVPSVLQLASGQHRLQQEQQQHQQQQQQPSGNAAGDMIRWHAFHRSGAVAAGNDAPVPAAATAAGATAAGAAAMSGTGLEHVSIHSLRDTVPVVVACAALDYGGAGLGGAAAAGGASAAAAAAFQQWGGSTAAGVAPPLPAKTPSARNPPHGACPWPGVVLLGAEQVMPQQGPPGPGPGPVAGRGAGGGGGASNPDGGSGQQAPPQHQLLYTTATPPAGEPFGVNSDSHAAAPMPPFSPLPDGSGTRSACGINPFAQRLPQGPIVATAATGDPTLDVISSVNWSVGPSGLGGGLNSVLASPPLKPLPSGPAAGAGAAATSSPPYTGGNVNGNSSGVATSSPDPVVARTAFYPATPRPAPPQFLAVQGTVSRPNAAAYAEPYGASTDAAGGGGGCVGDGGGGSRGGGGGLWPPEALAAAATAVCRRDGSVPFVRQGSGAVRTSGDGMGSREVATALAVARQLMPELVAPAGAGVMGAAGHGPGAPGYGGPQGIVSSLACLMQQSRPPQGVVSVAGDGCGGERWGWQQ